ncbi:hypothetical protein PF007_g29537 [Phytophthora fragariae]|uniref:Uncharacterized protein n=1 Tax=Phytophthora fragariae TaxID=53985 RepID=A0A6A3PRZ4_9STRA|nr:hypothetical protein PF007_g29537 [Phytophthora fragariae]KAE9167562.1 hypothetical protein PF004_g28786 [Phytophthora fragariae]
MNRLTRKKRVEQLASDFCKLRVLFLTGSEDHITDQGVIQQFFSRLANAVKEREVFDGVLHWRLYVTRWWYTCCVGCVGDRVVVERPATTSEFLGSDGSLYAKGPDVLLSLSNFQCRLNEKASRSASSSNRLSGLQPKEVAYPRELKPTSESVVGASRRHASANGGAIATKSLPSMEPAAVLSEGAAGRCLVQSKTRSST